VLPTPDRWSVCRARCRIDAADHAVTGQEAGQVCLDADRPDAGAAAAVGNAEGLVQVHVADIGADLGRAAPGRPAR
jgi:hypothetical protein